MKLKTLAKKPELTKIILDQENLVEKYGEPIEFCIFDRYDMDVYMKLLGTEERDFNTMSAIVKDMIYDDDGSKIFNDGEVIPSDILIKIVEEVIKQVGNSLAQTSK